MKGFIHVLGGPVKLGEPVPAFPQVAEVQGPAWFGETKAAQPAERVGIVRLPDMCKGPWTIQSFEVPPMEQWDFRSIIDPRRPEPGIYTRLRHCDHGILMSDTPAELADFVHRGQGKRYHGRVLVHGLGLGMCLRYLLDNRPVEHIDVVESDPDILDMVAPHYSDPRITYHFANALTHRFPKGTRWDFAWHDIWYSNDDDENAERSLLMRRYGRATGAQYTWGRGRGYRL